MKINISFYLLVAIFFAVSCNNNKIENNKTADTSNEVKKDNKKSEEPKKAGKKIPFQNILK